MSGDRAPKLVASSAVSAEPNPGHYSEIAWEGGECFARCQITDCEWTGPRRSTESEAWDDAFVHRRGAPDPSPEHTDQNFPTVVVEIQTTSPRPDERARIQVEQPFDRSFVETIRTVLEVAEGLGMMHDGVEAIDIVATTYGEAPGKS